MRRGKLGKMVMSFFDSKSVYLCGSKSNLRNYGMGWRKQIKAWLHKRGVKAYDPCIEETKEHRQYDLKKVPKHRWEKFPQPLQEKIRDKDLRQICHNTNFVVCFFTRYSTGTITELGVAGWKRIPTYIVTARRLVGWPATTADQEGNKVFRTFDELKRFLVVKYKLYARTKKKK